MLTVAQEHLCYAVWEMGRGSGSEGRDEGDGGDGSEAAAASLPRLRRSSDWAS